MAHDEEMGTVDAHFEAIRKSHTADSVILPRAVFEKLYLNPKTTTKNTLQKKVGNPTPIALIGFLVSSTPYSMITMGWRGAGGHGGAILTVMIWFGGLVQVLAAIGEWLIGNTFSCAVFFTYGCFWLVAGTGLMPSFATGVMYSETGNNLEGQQTPSFYATTGFFYLTLAIISTVYVVCALRTNVVLLSALVVLVVGFCLVAASYFHNAVGNIAMGHNLHIAAGALVFVISLLIWYLFIVQMLEAVDFPITLPVGDLSTVVPGKSQRMRRKAEAITNGDSEDAEK